MKRLVEIRIEEGEKGYQKTIVLGCVTVDGEA